MKTNDIRVHLLPALVTPEALSGGVSVVIDVLRATTTISAALAAGAREVIPCLEVADAWRAAANLPAGQVVLGGERGGVKIEGFTFGNSPREYTPESVGGKSLVFTTTNGTRAMLHAQQADAIWLAAFVNLSAVVQACSERPRIDVLCAGTGGNITREDTLLAGAIVARLTATAAADPNEPAAVRLNDQAAIARDAWLAVATPAAADPTANALVAALRQTQGGRNLQALRLDGDLPDAAAIDRYSLLPQFDAVAGRIVVR